MISIVGSSESKKDSLIIFVIFVSCFLEMMGSVRSSMGVRIRVIIIDSSMAFTWSCTK